MNFHYDPKRLKDVYPELVYVEGHPTPVNSKSKDANEFLDAVVLNNALNQVSDQKSQLGSVIAEYAKNPGKIMMLVFAVIVLIAFLGGL